MRIEITLPQLADSVTSAGVTVWLKAAGETVAKGEPVVEVDIDKTTVELEAPASGVLQDIQVPGGTDDVPVGTVLAVIDTAGDSVGRASQTDAEFSEQAASRPDAESAAGLAPEAASVSGRSKTDSVGQESSGSRVPLQSGNATVDASPLARRIADLVGLDLTTVQGSGPAGRVRKADVDRSRTSATS